MKETLELRVNLDFAHLLFRFDEGRNIGTSVKVVDLSIDDPRVAQVPLVAKSMREQFGRLFYFAWRIRRKYGKKEIETASLFEMSFTSVFEPAGESCGTVYDEAAACEICGANRNQVSPLKLPRGVIPKKDVSKTIAGEVVVSERFKDVATRRGLRGLGFEPIFSGDDLFAGSQLKAKATLQLTPTTVVGIDPFDLSTRSLTEVYRCPSGHTIGLNLISEPYVVNESSINDFDFFASSQMIGVKRGYLRPEPIYFCSPAMRTVVIEEKLTGFEFNIARIETVD